MKRILLIITLLTLTGANFAQVGYSRSLFRDSAGVNVPVNFKDIKFGSDVFFTTPISQGSIDTTQIVSKTFATNQLQVKIPNLGDTSTYAKEWDIIFRDSLNINVPVNFRPFNFNQKISLNKAPQTEQFNVWGNMLMFTQSAGEVAHKMQYSTSGRVRSVLSVPYYNDRVVLSGTDGWYAVSKKSSITLWDNGQTDIYADSSKPIKFYQNTNEIASFDASGNLAIDGTLNSYPIRQGIALSDTTKFLLLADTTAFNSKTLTTAQLSYKADTSSVLWKDSSGVNVLKNYGSVSGINTLTQKSTSSQESATLGAELLSASNWTATDWTGDFATGFTHTAGNTTALTNTLAAVTDNLYQITFTVSGGTTGSFTITFGGVTSSSYSSSSTWGVKATSTGTLSITPGSTFDKTIIISIKQITAPYNATYVIQDNTGANSFEIRNSLSPLRNLFVGVGSGRYNLTGSSNNFYGHSAGYSNTTGSYNNFYGRSAGSSNTTGSYNNFYGLQSGYSNTTGIYNNFYGNQAGFSNTTGTYNNFYGHQSGYSNTTGSSNNFYGLQSGYSNTTGSSNNFYGHTSGYSNSTGAYNNFYGHQSGYSNTTGSSNNFYGYTSGYSNSTGAYNNFYGYGSGYSNTTGSYNNFYGLQSGYLNTTGAYNNFYGYYSGYSNTTGSYNNFYGHQSGYLNTTGSSNNFYGYNSGRYCSDGTTGNDSTNYSVYIGAETKSGAIHTTGNTNEIVIGYGTIGAGSNTVRIGNSDITSIGGQVGWTTLSDGRFKINRTTDVAGMYFIKSLTPINYNINVNKLADFFGEDDIRDSNGVVTKRVLTASELKERNKRKNKIYTGLVAQDVKRIADSLGINFSGVTRPENETSTWGLDYAQFVPNLIKAVQEQQAEIDDLKTKLNALIKRVELLEAK